MNLSSVVILIILFALVSLALWGVWKKGAPCECGTNCKACLKAAKKRSCASSDAGSCGCSCRKN